MDKNGLQLLARLALPPNLGGACGTPETPEILRTCILTGECGAITEILPTFKTMWPELQRIGKKVDMDPTSYAVVEAYWLGNELLERDWKGDLPFHLVRVLHVAHNLPVEPDISAVNRCVVRWGKIVGLKGDTVTANLHSLKREGGKYELTQTQETVQLLPGDITDLKVGDTVAVHWGYVCKKLSEREAQNLAHWTKEILKCQV